MKKNDFLLIGLILLIAVSVMGYHYLKEDTGMGKAVIRVDGELYGEYDLSKDQTIDIQGTNTLEILDGKARMSFADCPDASEASPISKCISHTLPVAAKISPNPISVTRIWQSVSD